MKFRRAARSATRLTRAGAAFVAGVAICCGLNIASATAAGGPDLASDQRVHAVIEKWRCAVAAYLDRIHQLPPKLEHRYLILWSKRKPEYYVQCIFHDEDRQIYCEAASGFYAYADRIGSFATPQRLEALASLGYSTDGSKGNFSQDRVFHGTSEVAVLMIETVARVFQLSEHDILEFNAPYLSKRRANRVKPDAACALIS